MGKRKRQTKPPQKKKSAKLDKVFDCPFCGHEQSVDCFLERDIKVGRVECRVCGAKYKSIITHLDEEIDLYHKWIDACEEASKEKTEVVVKPDSADVIDELDDEEEDDEPDVPDD